MDERKAGKKKKRRGRGKGRGAEEHRGQARHQQEAAGKGGGPGAGGTKNANFLLNFKYEVPAVRVESYNKSRDYMAAYASSGRGARSSARPVKSHRQRQMEKDRFLHANFRFVLTPGASLEVLQDPEKGVQWPEIEHIVYSAVATYRCPICLDEPTAPRMTKCGHIYCWTCLLRYARAVPLTPSTPLDRPSVESFCIGEVEVDEKVKKCPICLQMFALQEVRSVEVVQQKEHLASKWVELVLLRCSRSHCLPAPAEDWKKTDVDYQSVPEYGSRDAVFSRFNRCPMPACKGSVIRMVLEKEKRELDKALKSALEDEVPWIELALVQIGVITQRLDTIRHEFDEEMTAKATEETERDAEDDERAAKKTNEEEPDSPLRECLEGHLENAVVEERDMTIAGNSMEEEEDDSLYYYQAIDGRRAFIHPLSQRALMNQFESNSRLPGRLIARLVEKEEHTVTDVTRKRFKFLSHLPLTSDFLLYEIDVSPFVEASALLPLEEKFLQRQRAREKVVQEKKQAARKQRLKEKKIQQKLQQAKVDLAPQSYPPISAVVSAATGMSSESVAESGLSATYLELLAYEESLLLAGHSEAESNGKAEEREETEAAIAPTWVSNSSTQVLAAQIKSRQNVPMAASKPAFGYGSPPLQGSYTVRAGVDSDDEFGGDDVEFLAPDYKNLFMQELRSTPEQVESGQGRVETTHEEAAPSSKKAKKGKRKKGVTLFGNASHRNYRS